VLIYLIQHAKAKEENEDPERPLSEKGVRSIRKMGLHLYGDNVRVDQILHSGKLRAKQTAEIIAKCLTPVNYKTISETDGLSPRSSPGIWDDRLKYLTNDLMLVGHMPHLGKLAALLLCGEAGKDIISFTPGCVVCLERRERGNWTLKWMLTPPISHNLAG
jgi:phosphohistidine phosphatase